MFKRAHIYVRGLVQGVGFRPFIYNIAIQNGIFGYVLNLGDAGVEIIAEGEMSDIMNFIKDIYEKKPSVSKIESLEYDFTDYKGEFKNFIIAKSDERKITLKSVIPVDVSICDVCITDIYKNKRYLNYPFTSCAQCGPRFTILEKLPYDRQNTSMKEFPLCEQCQKEYYDPTDRRYDAQGITCPVCGPKLSLLNNDGEVLNKDPIPETAKLLYEGAIIAIKGIGGYHIAVDAKNEKAVKELRKRRKRPSQPFAVMCRSLDEINKFAKVDEIEKNLLLSIYRPIVLLKKNNLYNLADSLAPGLDTIGVMLPYTGIHLLLLDNFKNDALIMTSGNYPGRPIAIDDQSAKKDLKNIVDYYLTHNRNIVNRCDDSVIRVNENAPIFLRRSRGFSPSYLDMKWDIKDNLVLSLGGEFNVTSSFFTRDRLITTQHIGDAFELDTLDYLLKTIDYFNKIYKLSTPQIIAHDMNLSFQTSRLAKKLSDELNTRSITVQHHHAHLAALMAENNLPKNEEILAITIDGVGFGDDASSWGGEMLVGNYQSYRRVAHLRPQPMPGGDLCAYYPARMLAAILSSVLNKDEIIALFNKRFVSYLRYGQDELDILLKECNSNSVHRTSSMGRLLDAISVLLGAASYRTYEGEPPMKLEALANSGAPGKVEIDLTTYENNGKIIFNTSDFLLTILEKIENNKKSDIAHAVHKTLATKLAEVACEIGENEGISTIGLTGGSAVNGLLFSYIKKIINKNNKKFIFHKMYPSGDGCISVGQAAVASNYL
uniref:Carbamoyltransferase n=1 Tax=Candidatus Methanomethylicus mesodigestus TaxID=1867258 RepID=A0A7C3IY07_9CREN